MRNRLLALALVALSGSSIAQEVIEVRCVDWLRAEGREKEIRKACPTGGMVPVDATWWRTLNECKQPENAKTQKCIDFAKEEESERIEAEREAGKGKKQDGKSSVFIALTPTEFAERFNQVSQFYRLKYRMPAWPAKAGKMSATIAQGVTVSAIGIDKGNAISKVAVVCAGIAGCDQAIMASALTIDPDADVNVLGSYIGEKLRGERRGQVMEMNGIGYLLEGNRQAGKIEMVIQAWDDE